MYIVPHKFLILDAFYKDVVALEADLGSCTMSCTLVKKAYPELNVKIIGSHAGLTVGEDCTTHQCIEDLSLMRTIPGMVVLSPCDGNETREAVMAMLAYNGPVYLRTGRCDLDVVTDSIDSYKFQIGKGVELRKGNDATIISTGLMVQEALKAAASLKAEGVYKGDPHTYY